jgi:putative glycosyltransferase
MHLSIVSTLYRSARFLEEFHTRVTAAAQRITTDYELILVNDGSPDDSLAVAQALFQADDHIRIIDLSRNFGHHKAMMTGLAYSRGELVFLLDSDLEEDPELLLDFMGRMKRTGADVVFGVQERRRGNWFERLSGDLYYTIYNAVAAQQIPRDLVTVRLMTARYVRALVAHQEREVNIAALWATTGFQQVAVPVQKRYKGTSTYTLRRKIAHVVDSVTSFSSAPLVFIFYLGTTISLLAGVFGTYLIIRRLAFGVLLEGWPSLIVSIWFLGGLTLFCLGIIGIYLSKMFTEVKQRPYTTVRQVYERVRSAEPLLSQRPPVEETR